jgi:hypothetical protein
MVPKTTTFAVAPISALSILPPVSRKLTFVHLAEQLLEALRA